MLKDHAESAGQPAMPHALHEVTIGSHHEITLPPIALRVTGWEPGDRLLVDVSSDGTVMLMRTPVDWAKTFAGALSDVFGSDEETRAYLEHERASWDTAEG